MGTIIVCDVRRRRVFRISLLTLIAVWFGVVVPLHPRGVIKLGGTPDLKACCRTDKSPGHDSKPKPTEPNCAICHFVATLDLPPAIGLDVPELGLVAQMSAPAPQVAPVIAWVVPSSERGPPAV